jgi:hypothetical protein
MSDGSAQPESGVGVPEVEVQRELTKRAFIEAFAQVTSLLLLLAFALLQQRRSEGPEEPLPAET